MHLGLRVKILSLFLLGFAGMALVGTLLLKHDLSRGFGKIERHEAEQLNSQFARNLTGELEHLNELNTDWANWDGMYHFVATLDPKFAEEEIGPGALTSARITFVEILDTHHDRRFFRAIQAAVGLQASADGSPFDEAISQVQRIAGSPQAQSACGLHGSSLGPVLMCWQPIHLTDQAGQSPGTLITGRFLDDHLLGQIRDQSGIRFQVTPISSPATDDRAGVAFHPKVDLDSVELGTVEPHVLTGRVLDFAGRPVMSYRVRVPEDLEESGQEITAKVIWILLGTVLLTGALVLAGVHFLLVSPLRQLQGQLIELPASGGRWPERIHVSEGRDEIAGLGNAVNQLLKVIHQQVGTLEQLSLADPLTRIANRRAFEQRLAVELNRHANERTLLALIVADVDAFKQYNDRHGQLHGDKVLQTVAEVLRSVAGRPSDLVARLDGAEFAVLLSDTDIKSAQVMAEEIRSRLAARELPHQNSPVSKFVTLSIGVTAASVENAAAFVSRAGRGAQESKQTGGDRLTVVDAPPPGRTPRESS